MKIEDINGYQCVITEEGKIDGYICRHCQQQVWGKSALTGVCYDCASLLLDGMIITYENPEEEPEEWIFETDSNGNFTF